MPPALVPIAAPCSQIVEQPLDLSKKVAFAISTAKENDTSTRNTLSPCEQKDDNPIPNVDNDDLEDSPLVIDEETTVDPVEAKFTPSNGETNTKVKKKMK
jgi:hypothetical protein